MCSYALLFLTTLVAPLATIASCYSGIQMLLEASKQTLVCYKASHSMYGPQR